jgi:acetylornithine deacetylase/succinyl-diaminopimelate desuccinylase-like protein
LMSQPGSINTMAHTVTFTLDIRHTSDASLAAIEKTCRERFTSIATDDSEAGCTLSLKLLVDSPAVTFHPDCISCVESSAKDVCTSLPQTAIDDGDLWKYMISGAGHDSCYTNRVCPTSMIFSVTREGVSHNPREHCSPEDCAVGTQVLLGAVLRYDGLRAERGDFA